MTVFYNYSEPFSAECRAYGRLREAGWEELAVRCLGYVLLDEEHERVLKERFGHQCYDFGWNGDDLGDRIRDPAFWGEMGGCRR